MVQRMEPWRRVILSGNYWVVEGLRWAIRAILLSEVGLDPPTVQSLLLQNVKLQHAARKLMWPQRSDLLVVADTPT